MSSASEFRRELADANRILAHLGVVDGFGHVSLRAEAQKEAFLIARSMAPALVEPGDILQLDLDGEPLEADGRRLYLERYIHAEIYRRRPDVGAVVHSHAPALIPFGTTTQPLRPLYHMAAGIGTFVPIFEIRDAAGDGSDLLIRDGGLGAALADSLGSARVVLMRGHGVTVAAASLREAVFIAVYAELNARLQAQALALGPVTFLSEREVEAAWASNRAQVDRAWKVWRLDALA